MREESGQPPPDKQAAMAFELSTATQQRIREEIVPRYPSKKSAILPVLWAVQREKGFVSREGALFVAEVLDLPPAHVQGVLTFYTMFHQEPVGKYQLQVCRTASCEILGSKEVVARLKERLGIDVGETTPDRMFTLTEVECLGCCELAPVVQVNEDNYGPMTPEKVDILLEDLRNGTKRIEPCL
jgi:NADH-quinone oxidoreductase E subunit